MRGNRKNAVANLRRDLPLESVRKAAMDASETMFQKRLDAFLEDASRSEIAAPGGAVSALEWLGGEAALARELRVITWCLAAWPYPNAPWTMLVPILERVERLMVRRVAA
jgi:hypothetical protein